MLIYDTSHRWRARQRYRWLTPLALAILAGNAIAALAIWWVLAP